MSAPAHVIDVAFVETRPGNQGPSEGYFRPSCSCGWVAPLGFLFSRFSRELGRAAWQVALDHAREASPDEATELHDLREFVRACVEIGDGSHGNPFAVLGVRDARWDNARKWVGS